MNKNAMAVWIRGLLCAAAVLTGGCNFDGSSAGLQGEPSGVNPRPNPLDPAPAPSGPTPVSRNAAPQIVGSPRVQVSAGDDYEFTPSASDADDDQLTFSIQAKPGWAEFNESTGHLHGMPVAADVGSYDDIVISVSDGKSLRKLPVFSIDVLADGSASGRVTIAWRPPTQNTDGSALIDLSGYRIHYGTSSGSYARTIEVRNPGVTSMVVDDLAPGTYYFAVTAVSSSGAESDRSPESSGTI